MNQEIFGQGDANGNKSIEQMDATELNTYIDANLRTIGEAAEALIQKLNKIKKELADAPPEQSGAISYANKVGTEYAGIEKIELFVSKLKKIIPEVFVPKNTDVTVEATSNDASTDQPETQPIEVMNHIKDITDGLKSVEVMFVTKNAEIAQLATKTLKAIDKMVTTK